MLHLIRSQASSLQLPALWWWAMNQQGYLANPQAAEFRLYSRVSGAWAPYWTGNWTGISLPATKLGTGRYAVVWTVPHDAPLGVYMFVVRWRLAVTDAWTYYGYEFEVWSGGLHIQQPTYAFTADATAEGITGAAGRVTAAMSYAGRFTETATQQYFEPRYTDKMYLNGSGIRDQELDIPAIAVEAVAIVDADRGTDLDYYDDDVIVFNRHMLGVSEPDDRKDPHLSLEGEDSVFPVGRQNIQISGVFGYVEPQWERVSDCDALVVNRPPQMIRDANLLMAWKRVPTIGQAASRADRGEQHRIKSESTEGQSYTLGDQTGARFFSGDANVDNILWTYRRAMKSAGV